MSKSWNFLILCIIKVKSVWLNENQSIKIVYHEILQYKTGVINDPLGQTQSHASNEHCFLLFCFSRFERTDGQHVRLSPGRDFGLAEWIKNCFLNPQDGIFCANDLKFSGPGCFLSHFMKRGTSSVEVQFFSLNPHL